MREHKKKKITNIIYSHIINNLKEYISVIIVLFIGIIIGVITLNNADEQSETEIQLYINEFVSNINENQDINSFQLLKKTFINNLIFVLLLIFIGSTVIGIPILYLMVAYKGFCFSYTISSIIAVLGIKKGITLTLSTILLQNIIYIPCILALAVSGIRLYNYITKEKSKSNLKLEILRHITFSGLIGLVFLSGSFIESYVSTNLLIIITKYFNFF